MSHLSGELELLLKVSSVLASTHPLQDMLSELLSEVLKTLTAERGFLVLKRNGQWTSVATHLIEVHPRLEPGRFSRTLVDHVCSTGETCVILSTEDCAIRAPSLVLSGLRSVICAPLMWDSSAHGAIYLEKAVSLGPFREIHGELLAAIAQQASRTLQTAWLQSKLQEVYQRSAFEKPRPEETQTISEALDRIMDGSTPTREIEQGTAQTQECRAFLFGRLRVNSPHSQGDWKSKRDRELFAYLALNRGSHLHEESLMERFWPEKPAEKARHSLHNSITQIRKILGCRERRLLERRQDCYTLASECWTDIARFTDALREGQRCVRAGDWEKALPLLHEAERLAEHPLLEGMANDWVASYRYSYADQLAECRTLLADHFHSRGKHLLALEGWRRILAQDPCHERACRGAVDALTALHRNSEAARVYYAFTEAFERELGLPPPFTIEP